MRAAILAKDMSFSCKCGRSSWSIKPKARQNGTHLKCYCADCQAYLRHLGHEEAMDDAGGTAIYQTTPEMLTLTGAMDHLACLRMTPKGAVRWYVSCCNTPLCNGIGSPKLSFAGVLTEPAGADANFGPVTAQVQIPKGSDIRTFGLTGVMTRFILRSLSARLTGRWRQNPLFDPDTQKPIRRPVLISDDDRERAYRS